MSAKNVKPLRAAHENWNKRDFVGVLLNVAEGLTYIDHDRRLTLNNRVRSVRPDAKIVSGGCYDDQYTLLTQLGHIEPLAVAA